MALDRASEAGHNGGRGVDRLAHAAGEGIGLGQALPHDGEDLRTRLADRQAAIDGKSCQGGKCLAEKG
jgi:hypothetical protein